MKTFSEVNEMASYPGNMGFAETFRFYQVATQEQVDRLEELMRKDMIKQAWALVQKVTGVDLHDK